MDADITLPEVKVEHDSSSEDILQNVKTNFRAYLGDEKLVDMDISSPIHSEIFLQLAKAEQSAELSKASVSAEYLLRAKCQDAIKFLLKQVRMPDDPAFDEVKKLAEVSPFQVPNWSALDDDYDHYSDEVWYRIRDEYGYRQGKISVHQKLEEREWELDAEFTLRCEVQNAMSDLLNEHRELLCRNGLGKSWDEVMNSPKIYAWDNLAHAHPVGWCMRKIHADGDKKETTIRNVRNLNKKFLDFVMPPKAAVTEKKNEKKNTKDRKAKKQIKKNKTNKPIKKNTPKKI